MTTSAVTQQSFEPKRDDQARQSSGRVLFVSANCPLDARRATYGAFQRQRLLIDGLVRIGAKITALFIVPPGTDMSEAARSALERRLGNEWSHPVALRWFERRDPVDLESRWSVLRSVASLRYEPNLAYAYDPALRSFIAGELAQGFDLVFVQRLDALIAVQRARPTMPVICDLDDVEHRKFARSLRSFKLGPRALILRARVPLLRRVEVDALHHISCGIVCSAEDRDYLHAECGLDNIAVVPNAVVLPPLPPPASGAEILFLGTYTYEPNVEAARFLVESIWPRIVSKRPDARLVVAGQSPERIKLATTPLGVEVVGYVDDLAAQYARATLVACPILNGGGTRIKILEAAAYGRAVVSTTIGAEGLMFSPGAEIELADTASEFADRCLELLGDSVRRNGMAARARARVGSDYDRDRIVAGVSAIATRAGWAAGPGEARLRGCHDASWHWGLVVGRPCERSGGPRILRLVLGNRTCLIAWYGNVTACYLMISSSGLSTTGLQTGMEGTIFDSTKSRNWSTNMPISSPAALTSVLSE